MCSRGRPKGREKKKKKKKKKKKVKNHGYIERKRMPKKVIYVGKNLHVFITSMVFVFERKDLTIVNKKKENLCWLIVRSCGKWMWAEKHE